jgi:N utilization substance protein B
VGVVLNECIELAKRFGAEQSHRYVNGVLDKLARQVRRDELSAKSPA